MLAAGPARGDRWRMSGRWQMMSGYERWHSLHSCVAVRRRALLWRLGQAPGLTAFAVGAPMSLIASQLLLVVSLGTQPAP